MRSQWKQILVVSSAMLMAACGEQFQTRELVPKELTTEEVQALDEQIRNEQLNLAENQTSAELMDGLLNSCKFAVNVPDKITRGTVLFTFDDGPSKKWTPQILDILDKHNVKGVFFVLGAKVKGNEAILQRMKDTGHTVANHSFDHPNFWALNSMDSYKQIKVTDDLLLPFLNETKVYRYPYGNSNCSANEHLEILGYKSVGWNVDTCDWAFADGKISDKENKTCQAKPNERENYVAYVKRQIQRTQGGVVLFHDIHEATVKNLEKLIIELKADGYSFSDITDKNIFPIINE